MRLTRTTAIVLRQYYLIRGSMSRVLPLFIWVGIDMVLWGFMTKYLNSITDSRYNFVPALLGTVLLWDFFARVMQGVTMAFFEDVWSRNFLNVFATPLSISEYVTGLVLSSILTSTIGLAVMLTISSAFFGLSFFMYGVMFVPFLAVLFLFGIALGIFGSAVVLRLGPAAEWFIWPIPALLSPFAGVFYPLATLPIWMRGISRILPASYVFEGMRRIVAGGSIAGTTLVLGIVLAMIYIGVAAWFFKRQYRHAVRTGLIARYSAETVS
jgi:ABC-2 type transport system permease protein